MSASCCAPRRKRASVGLVASAGLAYTPAALLALLVPKCPMCLGALLGLGLALPRQSYALVVAGSALLGTVLLVAVWRWLAPRRRLRDVAVAQAPSRDGSR